MSKSYITAVDLVAELEGISKKEAKRLLKQGAVSIAKDRNSPLEKVKPNQIFVIEDG